MEKTWKSGLKPFKDKISQPTFTCSESATENLGQVVKSLQS